MALALNGILQDVVDFGLSSTEQYLCNQQNTRAWEIPEFWPQVGIAQKFLEEGKLYPWLEVRVSIVLEWLNRKYGRPVQLECDRIGRLDLVLSSSKSPDKIDDLKAIIEVKRGIVSQSKCIQDVNRIQAISKLTPIYGIISGPYCGDGCIVKSAMIDSFKISSDEVCFKKSSHQAGCDYGFIAACVAKPSKLSSELSA